MSNEEQVQVWINFLKDRLSDFGLLSAYMDYIEKLIEGGFPVIFNLSHLSDLLGLKLNYLIAMIFKSESYYREFSIPKKNGGQRQISAPYPSLLFCQQWIYKNILVNMLIHKSAHGFVPQRSIVTNAEVHLNCKWLLKIDIEDFFPSISIQRIVWFYRQCGYAKDVSFFLARLCTLNDKLPQGSATSPQLSNVAFRTTDKRLSLLADSWKLCYTRYVDDLTFSGDYIPSKFIEIVFKILRSSGFAPNTDKTRLIGPKGRKIVTGISVFGESMKLPKSTRRQLRKEVHYLCQNGFEKHTISLGVRDPLYVEKLLGKLSFWKQIEPENQFVINSINNVRGIAANLNSIA